MPLVRTAEPDPLSPLIRFRTSLVFEMLLSLQSAAHEWRKREWAIEVRTALGDDFLEDLQSLYREFHLGCDFTEIAIDYSEYHDVPGFVNHVGGLSDRAFVFYILGRLYRLEEIPEKITQASLSEMINARTIEDEEREVGISVGWADDVGGLKTRLTRLWQRYWDGFFKNKSDSFEEKWIAGIKVKENVLFSQGGANLISSLTNGKYNSLPDPLPPEMPVTVVECIPSLTIYRPHLMFYGYGNVTILFDCGRIREGGVNPDAQVQDLIKTARALSDENRLKIIKFLADDRLSCNGKQIAAKLGISPSVVSRHLGQLRDAGIIEEVSGNNRTLSYSVKREKLARISEDFLDYVENWYE